MTNNGKFITFKNYTNDLMLAQSGLYELVPSKFIVLDNIDDSADEFDAEMTGLEINDMDEYHHIIRQTMYKDYEPHEEVDESTGTPVKVSQVCRFGMIITSGDVNILSHDIVNGVIFNEVYVHVNGESAVERTVMFENPSSVTSVDYTQLSQECFGVQSGDTVATMTDQNNDVYFEFDGVLVLYNVWNKVDGTLKYTDMPMGMYVLADTQTLYVSKESNYGSGTSWATRISLAMPYMNNKTAAQTEDNSTSYNTVIGIVEKLGEAIDGIQSIMAERAEMLEEKKSYYAEFKNNRHINVPYLVGDAWYVNGRYVKDANLSKDELISIVGNIDFSSDSDNNGECGDGCDSGSYDQFIKEVRR